MDDVGGVRRVRNEEQVVRRPQVDDQIVDDAAGRIVDTQRVLRLADVDAVEVVRQASS